MRRIGQKSSFKKDLKRCHKRKKDISKLKTVVDLLAKDLQLDESYRDHALKGNWIGYRDCHIEPDWVLIYKKLGNDKLELIRTGSHSDLF